MVLEFAYLKDLDGMDPSDISGVNGGKESEQGKGGGGRYRINYLQKPIYGKRKTSDSLPRSSITGGM